MAAAPDSIFKYGSYPFSFVKTISNRYEPVKDPSGTDTLYTRQTLCVEFIIAAGISPCLSGETPQACFKRIKHEMMNPRQALLYSSNGVKLTEVLADTLGADGNLMALDADRGPTPISFVETLTTQMSLTCQFTVTVCRADCGPGGRGVRAQQLGYTSHVWSESEDFDKTALCTLTTRGSLHCASDLRVNPDTLRHIIAPRIRRGYQRERSNYILSEDGLKLYYVFVDKEYDVAPPRGSFDARGTFVIIQSPGQFTCQCTVRLAGPKSTSKQDLMLRAMQIVKAKVRSVAVTDPSGKETQIGRAVFKEELYANAVEYTFHTAVDAKKIGTTASGVRTDLFGTELPGSPAVRQPGIAPSLRGNNQLLLLLASAFNDPCVRVAIAGLGETELQMTSGGLNGAELRQNGGPTGFAANQSNAQPTADASYQRAVNPAGPGDLTAALRPATFNPQPIQGTNPASIVVGRIPDPIPSVPDDFPYETFRIKIKYRNATGNTVLPSAWPGGENKKVKLHNPTLRMIVEWHAERIGSPPEIPDPCETDGNEVFGVEGGGGGGGDFGDSPSCNFVLIEKDIDVEGLQVAAGGYLHIYTGRYVYGVKDLSTVPLASPLPPFLVTEIRQKADPASGRLLAGARLQMESQITAIDKQIDSLNVRIDKLAEDALASDSPALVQSSTSLITAYQKNIADLQKQRSDLADKLQKQSLDYSKTITKRRREGDVWLNGDSIWYRLKTLKADAFWSNCPCDVSAEEESPAYIGGGGDWGEPTTEAELTGSPSPRSVP